MINSNYNNNYNEFHTISEDRLHHILNKEESHKIFWGLGEELFWMQIIDYDCHKFGKFVFDEGLHGGPVEPGFFGSLLKGCEFAAENLTEKLTVEFYKELNSTLCSHFIKGRYNNVLMNANEAGTFKSITSCSRTIDKNFFKNVDMNHFFISRFKDFEEYLINRDPIDSEFSENIFWERTFSKDSRLNEIQNLWIQNQKEIWMKKTKEEIINEIIPILPQALDQMDELEKENQVRAQNINDYITKICQELNVEPFVSINYTHAGSWLIFYNIEDPQLIGQIVEKLFNRYNDRIKSINNDLIKCKDVNKISSIQNQKLEQIAELFQLLEWLHPFPDGQGRTDLVLLSKLLSEEGFTPPILEKPYFSTNSTPSEWLISLQEGLDRFADYARIIANYAETLRANRPYSPQ